MNIIFYNIRKPKNYSKKEHFFGHSFYYLKNLQVLVPHEFSKIIIRPKNFYKIKNRLCLENICIVDKVCSNIEFVCIVDHVNRSGTNFLIGETPVKKFPVFPDMSKIYNTIPGYKQVVVHTLGPSRFLKQYKQKQITSESVGLISPIWHYVGVNVYAKNNMLHDI